MKGILILLFLGLKAVSFAQMDTSAYAPPAGKYGTMTVRKPYHEVYKVVEQMPEFPGGQVGLMRYLSNTPYPKEATENDIQGRVYIKIIIDNAGNATQASVVRSSGSTLLDEAALLYLQKMPKWLPGRQRGEAVFVEYIIPIEFKLS